jgi:glycosyltransferase involved in cell wall biosynthesis
VSVDDPRISVIIPTRDRAELLEHTLASLVHQTVPLADYEVVVVDDGSTDATTEVCSSFADRLTVSLERISPSGIAAAKNLGIFVSRAPVVLFFDDDDVADEGLLATHLALHDQHPEEGVAVLGYTVWGPWLERTPLMEFITGLGGYLFSYDGLADGSWLDHTYFWGGRSSCKRSLLFKHGVFNQDFPAIIEDIELAYRLRRFGLRVIFSRQALSYMNRQVTYDQFCARCERQGRAHLLFSQLHPEPEVLDYCRVHDGPERWNEAQEELPPQVERVNAIERYLESGNVAPREWAWLLSELRALYRATFEAFRLKGVADASRHSEEVTCGDSLGRAPARR